MSFIRTIILILISSQAFAQFAPPVGQVGSTAIHKDSSIFIAWATNCSINRGYIDIIDPSQGKTTIGDSTDALAKAGINGVVSLGDGGVATLTFAQPIFNGPGWDFAVFENAFQETFLELAFVEVSSDGINFFRFPASSHTQDTLQVLGFGALDAAKINNLAGKYIVDYGTPFDLSELESNVDLNINKITHIRVIDVVGCLIDSVARYDKDSNKINDPWRTNFASGGFDLDAVGVINVLGATTVQHIENDNLINIYPNPAKDYLIIQENLNSKSEKQIELYTSTGQIILSEKTGNANSYRLDLSTIKPGLYILKVSSGLFSAIQRVIVQ